MQELRAGHVYSSRPWTGTAAADLLFLTPPATPQLREAGAAVRIRCVGIRESLQPKRKVSDKPFLFSHGSWQTGSDAVKRSLSRALSDG